VSEDGYIPPPPVTRVRDAVSRRGIVPVGMHLARWGGEWLAGLPRTFGGLQPSTGWFSFQERSYPYLFHRYKHSWLTERTVEVPVVQALVDDARARGGRILEVGNVLSHYRPQTHLVVDKYERAPGVVNRDALELADLGTFDLIVAISTLEHVGHDELPREPGKALRAALALQAMLAHGGELVITLGVGYNAAFDADLRDGSLPRSRVTAMRRVGHGRRWREVPPDAVWSAPYDFLLYAAGGVVFVVAEAAAD
jgi:SAM-dependent methyltransferase